MVRLLCLVLMFLSSCLAEESEGEQCNIQLDKREGFLYHPAQQPEDTSDVKRSDLEERDSDKEGSTDLRATLLENVTNFPRAGTAGNLVVLGDNMEVIMTGSQTWQIVMIAGTYGQGRVIAFSHDGYGWQLLNGDDSAKALGDNCYKWVTKGGYDSSSWTVVDWNNRASLATADVTNTLAIFRVKSTMEDPQYVLDFVNRGGGLILETTPWPWGANTDLYKRYFQKVAIPMGFYFGTRYCAAVSDPALNRAAKAHFGRTLTKIQTSPGDMTEEDWAFAKEEINSLYSFDVIPNLNQTIEDILTTMKSELTWPVTDKQMLYFLAFMTRIYNYGGNNLGKAPGIYNYPFDFETQPLYQDSYDIDLYSYRKMAHSTGYYLPAGCEVEVIGTGLDNWYVRVGAADDDLSAKTELHRWPLPVVTKRLSDTGGKIYSAYGGPVYLVSPTGERSITYSLTGVVLTPQMNLSDPDSIAYWNESRTFPGLWADFFSEKFMITLPSIAVRHLADPSEMLMFWTDTCYAFEYLKSYGEIPHIWFAPDIQISAGYMHSGYPIATQLDVTNPRSASFLMGEMVIDEDNCGCWGPYHEIGHNLQERAWCFQGCGEVTNNIFSLYGYSAMQGIPVWENCWLNVQNRQGWRTYLDGGAQFDSRYGMGDAGTQLIIFAQMARDFGWDGIKYAFELFNESPVPRDYQGRIDMWVKHMSTASGENVATLFDFWGMPMSDAVWEEFAEWSPYEPDDVITQTYPDRMNAAIDKALSFSR